MGAQLEPDRGEIEMFVQALFRHAAASGYVSLRAFYEDREQPFRINPTSLSGGLNFVVDCAEDDARRAAQAPRPVVFSAPIATFANRRAREQDVAQGLALTVECDQHPREAQTKLEQILGPATVVVTSGGKWTNGDGQVEDKLHLHWRLGHPADDKAALQKFKRARGIASRIVGADPSGKSVVHPFRWPGSWHRKAEPILCRIEALDADREIDLDAALAALLAAAPAAQQASGGGERTTSSTEWENLIYGIISGESYHPSLIPLSAKLVAAGTSKGTAVNLLRALMENSEGARDERWQSRFDKIPTDVDSALEKYGRPNLPPTNAGNLKTMTFAPIKYVVPGIVVEGLTLLAGKPKIGKSWLLLHAAIAVARNGFTLGDIPCPEGDVLYCALEDNLRRLRARMDRLLGTQDWPERLSFLCEMPRLTDGGLQKIKEWITTAKHPRLVIIDTLAMVRSVGKKKDQTQYDADYMAVMDLRAFAYQHGVAIVLVHHLRKMDADDAFDTVSGTLGLTGAPDTILVLKRDHTGTFILHGRGRDIPEIEKAMTFNKETCTWTIAGEVPDVRASEERKKILAAMAEIGEPSPATEIAAFARMSIQGVRRLLSKMAKDGMVTRTSYGKYGLA